jgi:hypothetical protein
MPKQAPGSQRKTHGHHACGHDAQVGSPWGHGGGLPGRGDDDDDDELHLRHPPHRDDHVGHDLRQVLSSHCSFLDHPADRAIGAAAG